jgi:biopolymer transport protein ExbD
MAIGGSNNEGEIISDINLTPLIDIMLVLLIIFMTASSVAFQSGVDIDLPSSSLAASGDGSKQGVLVSLSIKGEIFVDGKATKKEKLKQTIAKALKKSSSLVVFEGDKDVSLQTTLEIMDVAKSAGAENFAITAKEK